MTRAVPALVVLCMAGVVSCALALGLEDHQAYPAEGGADGAPFDAAGDGGPDGGDATPPCDGGCSDGDVCYHGVCGGNAAVQVSAGEVHDCALLRGGEVWCWGNDSFGEILGAADAGLSACPLQLAPCRISPTRIPGLPAVAQISAGVQFTCALDLGGNVLCWGINEVGELGHDPSGDPACPGEPCNPQPTRVPLPGRALQVSAGYAFACAVVADDAGGASVYCWGTNATGQLGPNMPGPQTPTPQLVVIGATSVSAGWFHACARMADQSTRCWGSNQFGELGHPTRTGGDVTCAMNVACNPIPQPISVGTARVHAGYYATCIEATDHNTYCAGLNDYAELGLGNDTPSPGVTPVMTFTAIATLDLNYATACAINPSGNLWCWGDDDMGQIGAGLLPNDCADHQTECSATAHDTGLTAVIQVSTSAYSTLALTADGTVQAWGANAWGQLGHTPGLDGDSTGCDMTLFGDAGVCNLRATRVSGLP